MIGSANCMTSNALNTRAAIMLRSNENKISDAYGGVR